MARPRTFDEERALDGAMRLFWETGYEAASTQALCEATGLGRSSIYNTFSSKHALFIRALANYLDTMADNQAAILGDPAQPPLTRLRNMFTSVIDTEEANRRERLGIGCLGVNSSVELSRRDPEAARLLQRDLERRLGTLQDLIASGQHAGEISGTRSAREFALFLNATVAGMRVSAQNGLDRSALESIADAALDALAP
ncbi:TetR/AcrR family transcriptional regulator [Streptomyces sp. TRM S81-3]|uniref:TetR/AcrR family transcriptional regulator n=1 Tax=Streptomyces griseicoloratus TaxID=2752516 RepID=A0A926LBV1_9ACTN|nr:TetR/AcrR family transcriptional regulator [Streptomyces griseicoloratus]MBD0423723.1 TetR/AcrR family transcriptional regulator [Streptomyces griseicoloratus]